MQQTQKLQKVSPARAGGREGGVVAGQNKTQIVTASGSRFVLFAKTASRCNSDAAAAAAAPSFYISVVAAEICVNKIGFISFFFSLFSGAAVV